MYMSIYFLQLLYIINNIYCIFFHLISEIAHGDVKESRNTRNILFGKLTQFDVYKTHFCENKRNTELQWKPLPVLIVLPTHLEHIFTVSIAPRSCACF